MNLLYIITLDNGTKSFDRSFGPSDAINFFFNFYSRPFTAIANELLRLPIFLFLSNEKKHSFCRLTV